jgi:hypothetical protein
VEQADKHKNQQQHAECGEVERRAGRSEDRHEPADETHVPRSIQAVLAKARPDLSAIADLILR